MNVITFYILGYLIHYVKKCAKDLVASTLHIMLHNNTFIISVTLPKIIMYAIRIQKNLP